MSTAVYPATKPRDALPVEARQPETLPGTIWRNKTSGQLVGILSCDEYRWCELLTPSNRRYEVSYSDIRESFCEVAQGHLSVTSGTWKDTHGDIWVEREMHRVSQPELLKRLEREVGA